MLLKILVIILAIIGGIVVFAMIAIVALYFAVAKRIRMSVRQSLREFSELHTGVIDANEVRTLNRLNTDLHGSVPPMRIHLNEHDTPLWFEDPLADFVSKWMLAQKFSLVGDFSIDENPGARLRCFQSEDRRIIATFREDDCDGPAYVEFCLDLGDGRRAGVSNPPGDVLPLPNDALGEYVSEPLCEHDSSVLQSMLASARKLAYEHHAIPVDRSDVKRFFEQTHAAEMDFRIARGGLTEAEIRQLLVETCGAAEPVDIEKIQWEWQEAIEAFLIDRSRRCADVSNRRGKMIAVYDTSNHGYLQVRFSEYYIGLLGKQFKERAKELELLLQKFQPREALARFRPTLPENWRYSLVDQIREPVEADVYRLPQLD